MASSSRSHQRGDRPARRPRRSGRPAPCRSPRRARRALAAARRRRHRVPVDQDRHAARGLGLGDQRGQRRVIGLVHRLDPRARPRRRSACGRRSPGPRRRCGRSSPGPRPPGRCAPRAKAGSSSSNIAGSSSQGSRLTSMKARAQRAAITVAPWAGARGSARRRGRPRSGGWRGVEAAGGHHRRRG